jgi:hypothetical protein
MNCSQSILPAVSFRFVQSLLHDAICNGNELFACKMFSLMKTSYTELGKYVPTAVNKCDSSGRLRYFGKRTFHLGF